MVSDILEALQEDAVGKAMLGMPLKDWVGVVGGGIGIASAIGIGGITVLQYFATRDQLRTVDCRYKHKVEEIESALIIQVLSGLYPGLEKALAEAEVEKNKNPSDPNSVAAFNKVSKELGNAELALNGAKLRKESAAKGLVECGYREL